jgi:hypothetical protein
MGEGEGVGRGAESYDCKKAWSSINHSILAGYEKDKERKGYQILCYLRVDG